MEGKLEELFVRVTDCLEHLGKAVSHINNAVELLINETEKLRVDVDKLIENQKGGIK